MGVKSLHIAAFLTLTLTPMAGEADVITSDSAIRAAMPMNDSSSSSSLVSEDGDPLLVLWSTQSLGANPGRGKLRGFGGGLFVTNGPPWGAGGPPWSGGGDPQYFQPIFTGSGDDDGGGDGWSDDDGYGDDDHAYADDLYVGDDGSTTDGDGPCCREDDGQAVPEPAALLLMMSGVALAVRRAVTRRS